MTIEPSLKINNKVGIPLRAERMMQSKEFACYV